MSAVYIRFTYKYIHKLSVTDSQMLSPFSIGFGKEYLSSTLRIRTFVLNPGSPICYLCDLKYGINKYDLWFLHLFNEDNIYLRWCVNQTNYFMRLLGLIYINFNISIKYYYL